MIPGVQVILATGILVASAVSAGAQPDLRVPHDAGPLVVYQDLTRTNRYYYPPGKLSLVYEEGKPDLAFLLTRYVGTSYRGDKGYARYSGQLTFRVAMQHPGIQVLRAAEDALGVVTKRKVELRPLPIRRVEGQVAFAPVGGRPTAELGEGYFEADDADGHTTPASYWRERSYTLRLDRETAEVVWKMLLAGRTVVSLNYAFVAEGITNADAALDGESSPGTIVDRQGASTNAVADSVSLSEKTVLADALSVTLDPEIHSDLIRVVDHNERVPPAYSVLDVRCYDFRNRLRDDLYEKRVELIATSVTGRPARMTVVFTRREPDLYAHRVRFPFAVRLDQPLRYRVTEVTLKGKAITSPWVERDSWAGLIDVTTPAERLPADRPGEEPRDDQSRDGLGTLLRTEIQAR